MYYNWITLSEFKTLIEVVAIFLGLYVLIFVYLGFHPNMELKLVTTWEDSKKSLLLVDIEIKNISKVRCDKELVELQFIGYPCAFNNVLSEWVPFTKEDILSTEIPAVWNDPLTILETTVFWYPGDSIKIQRCYKCSSEMIYKLGLQMTARLPLLASIINLLATGKWKNKERWTTVKIIPNC